MIAVSLRVAVIGARGVGRFHAQWYAREGCEVVAFVCSRPDSVPTNEAALRGVVPNFSGRGYTDLRTMLEAEKPEIVSVCSPHALHGEHCLIALSMGAHVLCEKPLTWLGPDKLEETLQQTQAVVTTATQKGLWLAVNTQYMAAVPYLQQLFQNFSLPPLPRQLTLTMEARMRDRDTSGIDLWVDLAPHPLSLLLTLFPEAVLQQEGVAFEESMDALTARFSIEVNRTLIPVTIRVRRHSGTLERSIVWEDVTVRFEPSVREDGTYCLRLVWQDGSQVVEDFMQLSIRQFVRAVLGHGEPLCYGAQAIRQMEWLVTLAQQYLSQRQR